MFLLSLSGLPFKMNTSTQDGLANPQRLGAIITIALGITMAVLDGAIANVALPTIAADLNASPAESIWVVNAYQIAIIISLLSMSFIGDMVGFRRVYQVGLGVFCCTSLFCALSTSLEMLTFARVLQGLGGAAIMSVNIALIRLIYPKRFLGRGMGINSFIVAVSAAAGPTVAAAILSIASWKWLFLVNVPIGIVALIFAIKFLPPNQEKSVGQRFDIPSAIMNALTFGLLISAISGFSQGQSATLITAELLAVAIIGFFFIRRQLTLTVPLLPIDLLRIPIFSLSMCTSIFSFCAQMLAMVSLPFFLQSVLGRTEVETGSITDTLATCDYGHGAIIWVSHWSNSCRLIRWDWHGNHGAWFIHLGDATGKPNRLKYYRTDDIMWCRFWLISVPQ